MTKEDAYRFARSVREIEENGYDFDDALATAWKTEEARSKRREAKTA